MKRVLLTALALTSFVSSSAFAETTVPVPSIQIDVYGQTMAPKPEDFDAIRSAVGSAVTNLQVKKYVLKGTGIEGGFSACIEPVSEEAGHMLLQKMKSVHVDSSQTIYDVQTVATCE